MTWIRLIALLMIVMVLAGCRKDRNVWIDTDAPPTVAIEQVRSELGPDALVGIVYAVREQDNLVAVTDAPLDRFREGDAVIFVDHRLEPVAGGIVLSITERALLVRYDEPDGSQRTPRNGDFAVRIQ